MARIFAWIATVLIAPFVVIALIVLLPHGFWLELLFLWGVGLMKWWGAAQVDGGIQELEWFANMAVIDRDEDLF